jgi:hypothetical protein
MLAVNIMNISACVNVSPDDSRTHVVTPDPMSAIGTGLVSPWLPYGALVSGEW